ncbi:hypothetical protein KIH74_21210 [Kineosporia sp. J2-2]|uniref:Uncharacterized protein n=1 Tax=Kineosporia corallincola TaxID=2835133 RepID=A0ABS5TK49_9ACTN|nr:hypothetical protein [Kineosporia corallincola]MBT0771470.1 hypothetical protein [Kineosporia corallincola]
MPAPSHGSSRHAVSGPSRRGVLAAGMGVGVGAAAGVVLPAATARAATARSGGVVEFTLDAEVLDGGEQITGITLATAALGPVDPASLSAATFSVHARATSPLPGVPDAEISGVYDVDRTVTGAHVGRDGDIVLDLEHGEGVLGANTLGYVLTRGATCGSA